MPETNAGDPRIGVTTNERADTKHLVQPYSDAPVVNEGLDRTCAFCGNAGFRRSRVRFIDLFHFVMLTYPVRCTRCGQRQYVAFGVASQAQAARTQNTGPSPDKPGSWKAFTADVPSTLTYARPASTAAEPVAQRLDDAFNPGPPARLGVPVTSQTYTPLTQPPVPSSSRAAARTPHTPPAHTPSRRSDDSGIW